MIELVRLQKVVDQKTVLDIDALTVPPGEIAGVVGPIDSGGDTLFQLLTGRSRPTAGQIRLAGLDPFVDREEFSRQVGVLFPQDNLYPRQSARENLVFHCRLRRLPRSRAEEVLMRVGLADQGDIPVKELFSSLSRRLAFGRATLHNPRVLLLAEPFAKCDEASVSLLSQAIQLLAAEGAAILIFAEDDSQISSFCSTIYRLEQGRVTHVYRPGDDERPDLPFMIPARLEEKVILVDPVDILYVMAQHDRAYLQTTEGRLRTQFTLTELERRLARSGFFRAHRSYLVNLQHVKEVIPYTRDSFNLRLKDSAGTKIPLSKAAARELRDLLQF